MGVRFFSGRRGRDMRGDVGREGWWVEGLGRRMGLKMGMMGGIMSNFVFWDVWGF